MSFLPCFGLRRIIPANKKGNPGTPKGIRNPIIAKRNIINAAIIFPNLKNIFHIILEEF